jgi:hypothetical protein
MALKLVRNYLLPIGVAFVFTFLLIQPVAVFAVNGQDPNRQIKSTNTSSDIGSWARLEEQANQKFHFTGYDSTLGEDAFSMQLNVLTNGAPHGCGLNCQYNWALQDTESVLKINPVNSTKGAWLFESHMEGWVSSTGSKGFCQLLLESTSNTFTNLNDTGSFAQMEFFLHSSTQVTNSVTVVVNGGTFYTNSMTCAYPSGYGPVTYMTWVEGIIGGVGNRERASFSPLQSEIFTYGYIDLVSNYNQMNSYYPEPEMSLETSNLYQSNYNYYSSTYGSLYLYTVQYTQNTQTGT